MASHLFSPISFRGTTLNNRIVVSSMCQYLADDGSANDWHLMHYGQYAMGAGALVFLEATHVSPEGRITPRCLGLYSDENEAELKRVIDFCKLHGVAKFGIQLAHAGRKGSNHTPLNGSGPLSEAEGAWQRLGPSGEAYADWPAPQALDSDGLAMVKAQFVQSAERAARLDIDVAELHGGHGYLLHQFVSPIANRRNDGYGGPLENRLRFPLEVFEAVRAVWPENRPAAVRFSATDWVDDGFNVDEAVVYARELKALGCDFIDVTSGGMDPSQKIELGPGYQVHLADRIRREVDIPVMAVGMITDPHQAEEIIASGKADLAALARGIMDDPHWAWHAAKALGAKTEYPDQYVRCNPDVWKV
ncbi:MAG: NADH:flavin oxidoreductase/NADH oxidase [Rhodospirillaceae bacterium]|nr:NADH:flavin oxidoreductase/NADH oxidase [Rhodospirillaceae bacterium]MBT6137738.1 NADH:flavin oxidoreductase/NADH oxidase [Rhodospirillaceae bacterium]